MIFKSVNKPLLSFLICVIAVYGSFTWFWNKQVVINQSQIEKVIDSMISPDILAGNYFRASLSLLNLYRTDVIACVSVTARDGATLVKVPEKQSCDAAIISHELGLLRYIPFVTHPLPFLIEKAEGDAIQI